MRTSAGSPMLRCLQGDLRKSPAWWNTASLSGSRQGPFSPEARVSVSWNGPRIHGKEFEMVTTAIRAVRAGAIVLALFGFAAGAQAQAPSAAQQKLARQVVD